MKLISLFCFISSFFLLACNSEQTNNRTEFEYSINDTLVVPINDYLVKVIDYNENSDLVIYSSTLDFNTLVVSNSKGEVKSKFRILGEGPNYAGSTIFNIGFFSDNAIAVQANSGITFYTTDGRIIGKHKMESPTTKPFGGGTNPRIRVNGDSSLIGFIKSSIFAGDLEKLNLPENKEAFKPIVNYNLSDRKHVQIAGISRNSQIAQDNRYYPYLESLFDYDKSQLVSITNPEPIVDFYNKDFDHLKSVSLELDEFNAPISFKTVEGSNYDNRHMFINGKIKDINLFQNKVYVSYSSGVTEDQYEDYKNKEDMPGLFRDHLQYFTTIIDEKGQQSNGIKMPYGAVGIGYIKSDNHIVLNTNASITETKKGTVFYVASLKKVD